jgi:hypothetical protein
MRAHAMRSAPPGFAAGTQLGTTRRALFALHAATNSSERDKKNIKNSKNGVTKVSLLSVALDVTSEATAWQARQPIMLKPTTYYQLVFAVMKVELLSWSSLAASAKSFGLTLCRQTAALRFARL